MKQQNFHSTIIIPASPGEAFDKITRVSEWWTKNLEGNSKELNDVFTVRFGDTFVTMKLTEVIPNMKIIWHVTDCNLHWIDNKKEWKNTEMSFEISGSGDTTQINFTHIGLKPGIECYNDCQKGWTGYIQQSLLKFIADGKGQPDEF